MGDSAHTLGAYPWRMALACKPPEALRPIVERCLDCCPPLGVWTPPSRERSAQCERERTARCEMPVGVNARRLLEAHDGAKDGKEDADAGEAPVERLLLLTHGAVGLSDRHQRGEDVHERRAEDGAAWGRVKGAG